MFRIRHRGSEYDGDVVMLIYGPQFAVIHSTTREHVGETFSGAHNELGVEPINLEV